MMPARKLYENQRFEGLICPEFDFKRCELQNCVFMKCDFSGHDLTGAKFLDCKFIDCVLANAKVGNCSFQNAAFNNCKIIGVNFSPINKLLLTWSFNDCLIEFCLFHRLSMKKTGFIACLIKETEFDGADLTEAIFSGSDLEKTRFINADLRCADFSGARNYYIDPTQNKIKGAKFRYPEVMGLLSGFEIEIGI